MSTQAPVPFFSKCNKDKHPPLRMTSRSPIMDRQSTTRFLSSVRHPLIPMKTLLNTSLHFLRASPKDSIGMMIHVLNTSKTVLLTAAMADWDTITTACASSKDKFSLTLFHEFIRLYIPDDDAFVFAKDEVSRSRKSSDMTVANYFKCDSPTTVSFMKPCHKVMAIRF